MENTPLVSVIIPTFNRADLICKAIDSVLGQTYENVEIIVVDDGSTDETNSLIKTKYSDLIRYYLQENRGVSVARTFGFQKSRGSFIGFLDSDDYFLPQCIEKKLQTLMNDLSIDWVFSDQVLRSEDDTVLLAPSRYDLKLKSKLTKEQDLFSFLFSTTDTLIQPNTCLIRRKCLESIGGFDPESGCEDYEFFIRLAKFYKGKFIPDILSVQTKQQHSRSTEKTISYNDRILLIKCMEKKYPVDIKNFRWMSRFSKWHADVFNYTGNQALARKDYEEAISDFLKSLRFWPFQKGAYVKILKSIMHK